MSKTFVGKYGTAYLFETALNVECGPCEERQLTTGLHSVADIFCTECSEYVGWTYHNAYARSQKYKIGKFILELGAMEKQTIE